MFQQNFGCWGLAEPGDKLSEDMVETIENMGTKVMKHSMSKGKLIALLLIQHII